MNIRKMTDKYQELIEEDMADDYANACNSFGLSSDGVVGTFTVSEWKVLLVNDEVIGTFQLDKVYASSVALQFYILKKHRQKGYGYTFLNKMAQMQFTESTIKYIRDTVYSNNKASIKLHEKANYTCEAIIHDVGIHKNQQVNAHLYVLDKEKYLSNQKLGGN